MGDTIAAPSSATIVEASGELKRSSASWTGSWQCCWQLAQPGAGRAGGCKGLLGCMREVLLEYFLPDWKQSRSLDTNYCTGEGISLRVRLWDEIQCLQHRALWC